MTTYKTPEYYPVSVCFKCGMDAAGTEEMENVLATWHMGGCDVCGEDKALTDPRNFGSPDFKGYKP